MATQTKQLAVMDGGLFVLSFDYDDVTLSILAVHVVNTNTRSYTVSATSTTTGKNYTISIPAGTNIDQAIPPGSANRLGLTVTPSGKLDGVEWAIF